MWQQHWHAMSDDVSLTFERTTGLSATNISAAGLEQYILFEIEILLNSNASSSSLRTYGLPMPRSDLLSVITNRLLMEEKNYELQKLASDHELLKNALNAEQLGVYNLVITSASGKIVLAVAASGIASLLLPSGRTAHSRFKIPLNLTDDSICFVKKNTHLARLLTETSLIIWDEAPMNDRRCFESLDKTLKDILDNQSKPFGGKSVLLGGDFRQTLPIKPKALKSEIINSSLPKSNLWVHFKLLRLTENMRLHRPNLTNQERDDIA
ncbi:uncharacterized protein LOC110901334 [Helianthus annuus]|uniref:uncharacterized protein LOC110901334 n=1 Tax=Helianthus annuus TaxID=4232 RepID=UPI000B8F8A63|nr:uncharacterized protein LOC110901334 [Helianthus annuus]